MSAKRRRLGGEPHSIAPRVDFHFLTVPRKLLMQIACRSFLCPLQGSVEKYRSHPLGDNGYKCDIGKCFGVSGPIVSDTLIDIGMRTYNMGNIYKPPIDY